jgi:hypothetical protein
VKKGDLILSEAEKSFVYISGTASAFQVEIKKETGIMSLMAGLLS